MIKKKKYKWTLVLGVVLGIIAISILYAINLSVIIRSYNEVEGMSGVVWVITIRIVILLVSAFYVFRTWFKQEAQYLSDLPFLFGLFFLLLAFGKSIDLLFDLTYYYYSNDDILTLIKIRFIIVIFTAAPLVYLSIGMILYSLSLKEKYQKLKKEKRRNTDTFIIIFIIVIIEIIAVLLTPNTTIIGILLPFIVIPSFITIVWLFTFAHKNKRLSQVNSLILALGFGAYLISQIIRPLLHNILGAGTTYLIIAEIIDLIIFIIIFIGFYLKANYESE